MQPRYYNACPPVVSLQGFPRTPAVLQWLCLVKRSRALRGRNPTRNSQVKVRQGRVRPLAGSSRWRLFFCRLDTLRSLRKSAAAKYHALIFLALAYAGWASRLCWAGPPMT